MHIKMAKAGLVKLASPLGSFFSSLSPIVTKGVPYALSYGRNLLSKIPGLGRFSPDPAKLLAAEQAFGGANLARQQAFAALPAWQQKAIAYPTQFALGGAFTQGFGIPMGAPGAVGLGVGVLRGRQAAGLEGADAALSGVKNYIDEQLIPGISNMSPTDRLMLGMRLIGSKDALPELLGAGSSAIEQQRRALGLAPIAKSGK